MSSDIEFGELEQAVPQQAVRPDQDGHFAVAQIGQVAADDLKIYVDLDVMRDMEAHARSNTRVELGGVLLGQQQIDDQGRPFVIVTDSLRALHYEATQGSFKFTHDTWSQITRDRQHFHPQLAMIGWYHTHPGWSVFLSGMDLFICQNFFNRPLDVALVIDPCADQRGWFQWDSALSNQPAQKRPTGGYFLTTGRFRRQELEYFARIYNHEPNMNVDPRYGAPVFLPGGQPTVNKMDSRKPVFEMAVVSMLLIQALLAGLIAWRLLSPASQIAGPTSSTQLDILSEKLDTLAKAQVSDARDAAYREIMQSIISAQTGEHDLVQQFADLKSSQHETQSNLRAQIQLAEQLAREQESSARELKAKTQVAEELSRQLVTAREQLSAAKSELAMVSARAQRLQDGVDGPADSNSTSTEKTRVDWWWLAISSVVAAAAGGSAGFALAKRGPLETSDPFSDGREKVA